MPTHYEGQEHFGGTGLKNAGGLGTLYVGLYTNNTALAKNATMANVTELTGGGYARIALPAADWTLDALKTALQGSLYKQPKKTWTFTAGVGNVYGYFITTAATGTGGKLLISEHFPAVVNANQVDFQIHVTPTHEIK